MIIRYILLAILLLLIARAVWRLIDGVMEAAGGEPRRRGGRPAVKLVRDPVCGTWVAPSAALSLPARGSTHYFCSETCREQFRKSA